MVNIHNTHVIDQCAVLLDLAALKLLRLLITRERAKNVYKISHYQSPHLAGSWHSGPGVLNSLDTGLWLVNTGHVTWILASDWCCEQLDNDNLLTQGHRVPEQWCSLRIGRKLIQLYVDHQNLQKGTKYIISRLLLTGVVSLYWTMDTAQSMRRAYLIMKDGR